MEIKCTYSNGDTITTRINGNMKDAEDYFLNQWVNLGNVEDDIQQCVKVERV